MGSGSDRDRRKYLRIDVLGDLSVRAHSRPQPPLLRNLSACGFAIETQRSFEAGVSYVFEFQFVDSLVEVIAICIHCQSITSQSGPAFFAGFAFEDLDHRARAVVRAFIDQRINAPAFPKR